MPVTPEQIRLLLERHDLALERQRKVLDAGDPLEALDRLDALNADFDELTACLPTEERRAVSDLLEAIIVAHEGASEAR
jgi:hypothetical protein